MHNSTRLSLIITLFCSHDYDSHFEYARTVIAIFICLGFCSIIGVNKTAILKTETRAPTLNTKTKALIRNVVTKTSRKLS